MFFLNLVNRNKGYFWKEIGLDVFAFALFLQMKEWRLFANGLIIKWWLKSGSKNNPITQNIEFLRNCLLFYFFEMKTFKKIKSKNK